MTSSGQCSDSEGWLARGARKAANGRWATLLEVLEYAFLAVTAGVLIRQLILPPVIGLANNGDFERIMGWFGIYYPPMPSRERYFDYIHTHFVLGTPNNWSHYLSSELLLVGASLLLNAAVGNGRSFDLRVLGAVHAALLVLGVSVLLRALRRYHPVPRLIAGAIIVLVATDVSYVAYLNSFYSEPATMIFLAFLVGAALLPGSVLQSLGLVLSAVLFVTSKPQVGPEGVVAGLLVALHPHLSFSRGVRIAAGLAIAAAGIGYTAWATPRYMREANLYDTVFYEILPHSPSPQQDLESMGLPPSLTQFSGTTAYTPGTPLKDSTFRSRFFEAVNDRTVLEFYLSHPARFADLLVRSSPSFFLDRPTDLGNYEQADGLPPRAQSRAFDTWSALKERIIPRTPGTLIGFITANVLAAVSGLALTRWTRRGLVPLIHLALSGMMIVQVGVVLIGEGQYEIIKHLLLFNLLADGCMVILAAYAAAGARSLLANTGAVLHSGRVKMASLRRARAGMSAQR